MPLLPIQIAIIDRAAKEDRLDLTFDLAAILGDVETIEYIAKTYPDHFETKEAHQALLDDIKKYRDEEAAKLH